MASSILSGTASNLRELPLALVRIAIGWHLLYEGLIKLFFPGWTSAGYLSGATGPVAGLFHSMGANESAVAVIDQLNIWGLVLIGLALMLGVLARPAAVCGVLLLGLYYAAQPPLFSPVGAGVSEGNYLLVNKNLVELLALAVVAVFPAVSFGLGSLLPKRAKRGVAATPIGVSRRQALTSMVGIPFLGGFVLAVLKKHGWKSFEEIQLAGVGDDFVASATLKSFKFTTMQELQGTLPMAKIGGVSLSRMILGGNLIGGWAHARDLIYVSKLVKAYHHQAKIYETLYLAESCGVNALLTNPQLCGVVNDYWREGGKIQFISDCGGQPLLDMVRKSVDQGACACYIQGETADKLVAENKFDEMAAALDLIRQNKVPAGIGGHKLETITRSVEAGLKPDFWMKTFHHVNYWSAIKENQRDNIWCENPEETAAFMADLEEPWIAFKTLAAGAIPAKEGFQFAFDGGADFICVGMYDFQVVDDVNIAREVLNGCVRQRPWRG